MNLYAIERARELERELGARSHLYELNEQRSTPEPRKPRKAVFGPLAAKAGRALRRAGEGLESWGTIPAPEESRAPRRAR